MDFFTIRTGILGIYRIKNIKEKVMAANDKYLTMDDAVLEAREGDTTCAEMQAAMAADKEVVYRETIQSIDNQSDIETVLRCNAYTGGTAYCFGDTVPDARGMARPFAHLVSIDCDNDRWGSTNNNLCVNGSSRSSGIGSSQSQDPYYIPTYNAVYNWVVEHAMPRRINTNGIAFCDGNLYQMSASTTSWTFSYNTFCTYYLQSMGAYTTAPLTHMELFYLLAPRLRFFQRSNNDGSYISQNGVTLYSDGRFSFSSYNGSCKLDASSSTDYVYITIP